MAHAITHEDEFTETITVPDGTDSRSNAANVVEAIAQGLANRTRYLDLRVAKLAAANLTPRSAAGGFVDDFFAVAFGVDGGNNRCWVAVGDNAQYSTNEGRTWSAAATDMSAVGVFFGVAYAGNRFVAVGGDGSGSGASARIRSSTDGSTWTARTPGSDPGAGFPLRAVTYGALFVAVGLNGHIQTSPDGTTWTKRTPASATDDLSAITYGNGLYVAVGDNGSGRGVVEYSADGITWSRVLLPATVGGVLAVATDGEQFLAAGYLAADPDTAVLYTSTDGATWTLDATMTDSGLVYGATCLNGLFVLSTETNENVFFGTNLTTLIVGAPGADWSTLPVQHTNSLWGVGNNGYKVMVVGGGGWLADSLQITG